MIHHPNLETIHKFSKGELNSPLSAMVAAHLELCLDCANHYQSCLHSEVQIFTDQKVEMSSSEIDEAFDSLMAHMEDNNLEMESQSHQVNISISGESFNLPSAFSFLKDKPIPWKEFGTKNAIAPISISPEGNFYLIYIGPGEKVPEHNHTHIEYSYVAAGSYQDGISQYQTGDFSFTDKTHRHAPMATSDDGCLVISWVEGRLNYFKGILSPLNSLLWWYLHRA
ncbi:MAG: ChrR family anti-sigma-E factor [Bacteriovoracaceae bacterium]